MADDRPTLTASRFNVSIEGRTADSTALLSYTLDPKMTSAFFHMEIPAIFQAYGVRILRLDFEENPGVVLAKALVDTVPQDIWDACTAAIESGEDGKAVAMSILDRWRNGE